jgi:hypothetical protein
MTTNPTIAKFLTEATPIIVIAWFLLIVSFLIQTFQRTPVQEKKITLGFSIAGAAFSLLGVYLTVTAGLATTYTIAYAILAFTLIAVFIIPFYLPVAASGLEFPMEAPANKNGSASAEAEKPYLSTAGKSSYTKTPTAILLIRLAIGYLRADSTPGKGEILVEEPNEETVN